MKKNLCNLSNEKLSTFLSFIIGVVGGGGGRVVWGRGEGGWDDGDLNKWNQGNH